MLLVIRDVYGAFMDRRTIFVGYASEPATLADTVRSASMRIGQIAGVDLTTWEDLRIGGRVLLDAIEAEIRDSDVSIFDLTQLNTNVLFELGIAIAGDRMVWPIRDFSDQTSRHDWNTIGLLDTIGQARFTSSEEIFAAFVEERPDLATEPLYSSSLEQHIIPGRSASVLYLAEPLQTDAGRAVSEALRDAARDGLELVTADPQEASLQTLPWFVQHLYTAEAVVIHMASTRRRGATAHNARASLVAGLARGFRKPLLMLAEDDYESALDYRDLLFTYSSAADARTRTTYWLGRTLESIYERLAANRDADATRRLSTELRSVDLGEYVAENEAAGLARYYVETSTYREVIAGASRVYVGSKGAGKSATVLRTEAAIREDKRNLVCLIKPAGYDLNGLVKLLRRYEARDSKGYVAESLWKYLLATELALAVERDLAARPAGVMPKGPEWDLLEFISVNSEWLKTDFASRLERAVDALIEAPTGGKLADERRHVAEALHAGPLKKLRELLGPALAKRRRIYVLVDNLDKAWDRGADLEELSRLILGLLSCMDAFRSDLERATKGDAAPLTLALFLRSDIFASVSVLAREPDKLPVHRLQWDLELPLLDVIEKRYEASREQTPPAGELWSKYFCDSMRGEPVQDWILRVCLPRPRDVLYLCRAAIDHAVARRQMRVGVDDLAAAERQYSLFAFEAAAVETQYRIANADDLLLEFAGAPTVLTASQLDGVLAQAGADQQTWPSAIDALRDTSFLGVVTDSGTVFTDSPREKQRADVLATRAASRAGGEVRYSVHPAHWAYLELVDVNLTPNLGV